MARTSEGIQFGTPVKGKSAARAMPGRLCEHDGCSTVLSTYNSSTTCWLHAAPSYARPLDRP